MTPVEVVWLVFALVLGMCVGSFTNVIIDRLPLRLDEPNEYGEEWDTNSWSHVLGGESRCSSCGAPIRAIDKIPVVSWFALRGRCRSCHDRIPAFHPLVEAAVPLIGLGIWASLGWSWRILPALWLVPVGVAIAVIDLRVFMVPTRIVWPAFGVSVVLSTVAALVSHEPRWLLGAVIGVAILAGPLFLLWLILPGAMGFGDVRLAVLAGWSVGFMAADARPVASLYLALLTMIGAAALGIALGFLVIGARGLKAKVPFGPPLIVAAWVCMAFAPQLRDAFKL